MVCMQACVLQIWCIFVSVFIKIGVQNFFNLIELHVNTALELVLSTFYDNVSALDTTNTFTARWFWFELHKAFPYTYVSVIHPLLIYLPFIFFYGILYCWYYTFWRLLGIFQLFYQLCNLSFPFLFCLNVDVFNIIFTHPIPLQTLKKQGFRLNVAVVKNFVFD